GLGSTHIVMQAGYDLVNNKRFEINVHATPTAPTQGNQTDYVYDGLYRVVETRLPFPGAVIKTGYDLVGNKVRETDANGDSGNVMINTYDKVYRLLTKADRLQNVIAYEYDRSGNVVKETHTSQGTTTTIIASDQHVNQSGGQMIDGLGRPRFKEQLVYLGDPKGAAPSVVYTTSYLYDDHANRVVTTEPRGNDPNDPALGRLEELRDGLNRLQQRTVDWDGPNAPNPIAKQLAPLAALNLVTRYTYDANGNEASTTDPENNMVTFTYDGLNRKVHTQYPLNHE